MEKWCHDWPVGWERAGLALGLIAPAVLCVSVCMIFAGSPGGVRYCTGRIEGCLGTRGRV